MNSLRFYPRNSAHAAARIVVLAMLSDGQLQPAELAILEAVAAPTRLGLSRQEWHDLMHDFCTDLLASASPDSECLIDARMVSGMFADVDDDALRALVLSLCTELVNADGQIHRGEYIVLLAAIDHWDLYPVGAGLLDRPELVQFMCRGTSGKVEALRIPECAL